MDNLKNFRRTNYCGDLRLGDTGKTVSLCGWVQRQRDLGGLIFVDLRDRTGLVQLSFDDGTDQAVFEKASSLRSEYVIAATGTVRERESKTDKIATGAIEVYVTELRLLAKAETPPFEIVEHSKANDMLRLKYRYLDLRRPDMQKMIATRHKVTKIARDYFDEQGFYEIETPMLTKSTPEGAAGELKHGTISLIEDGTLVVALASWGDLFDKLMSNVKEVKARGADVVGITTRSHGAELAKSVDSAIQIPDTHPMFLPSLEVVPMQLFAYYVALMRGCDIDKPRNLAKSVTVE